jgi:cytidylate kinase
MSEGGDAGRPVTIAVDGPAGSGKTTVARAVAARLGLPHVDTGAMYRAVTLKALQAGVPIADGQALRALLDAGTTIDLDGDCVYLDGTEVTAAIRAAPVTAAVSEVAAHPAVREWMVARQRTLLGERGGVMEGRDIGTVVLPGADFKFFLTATPQERARRRTAELSTDGVAASEAAVLQDILARDLLDSGREASPLRVAPGATVIDSTGLTVDQVVDAVVNEMRRAAR